MNERFVKVEILIDTTSSEQLQSLGSLLATIGSIEIPTPSSKPAPSAPAPAAPEAPTPKPATTKKRTPSKPAEPAPAPEAPAEPVEEEAKPAAEAPASEDKEYTVEEVREKLKEKVNDHREAIKAKLTELVAPNVSSLDASKYTEFVNFLEGLE